MFREDLEKNKKKVTFQYLHKHIKRVQDMYPSLITDEQKDYLIPGKVQIIDDTAVYKKIKTLEIKEFENEDKCCLCNSNYENLKCSKNICTVL